MIHWHAFRPTACGIFVALCAGAAVLASCTTTGGGQVGQLKALSMGGEQAVQLDVAFDKAVYRVEPEGEPSFVLSSVPFNSLRDGTANDGQVLHVSLLWQPMAGATPMDTTATNAAVRWVIITQGHIGIYGGAGFATLSGEPGDESLTVTLRDGTVKQIDATPGFHDLLTPAQLTGSFTATLDDDQARRLRLAASQFVTNVFGRTKFVHNDKREADFDFAP